jgi:hypothetical protein
VSFGLIGWGRWELTCVRSDDAQQIQAANLQGPQDELMNLMTIMYMAIQETLSDPFGLPSVRAELCE